MTKRRSTLSKKISPSRLSQQSYSLLLRQMNALYEYTYDRLERYPKSQRLYIGLGSSLLDCITDCLQSAIKLSIYDPTCDREAVLRNISSRLKLMHILIKHSYRKRYITDKNRVAWSRMVSEIDDYVVGLAMGQQNDKRDSKSKKAADDTNKEEGMVQLRFNFEEL